MIDSNPLKTAIDTRSAQIMRDLYTALPAYVVSYDSSTQLATLQIVGSFSQLPLVVSCPVLQLGGKDNYIQIAIKPDDQGLVVFAKNDVSRWVALEEPRTSIVSTFDLSDAFFVPGFRAIPSALQPVSDGIQLKTPNSEIHITESDGIYLRSGGGTVHLTQGGDVNMTINNLNVTGTIKSDTDVIAAGISLKNHTHPQGNDSNGDAQQDVGPPK